MLKSQSDLENHSQGRCRVILNVSNWQLKLTTKTPTLIKIVFLLKFSKVLVQNPTRRHSPTMLPLLRIYHPVSHVSCLLRNQLSQMRIFLIYGFFFSLIRMVFGSLVIKCLRKKKLAPSVFWFCLLLFGFLNFEPKCSEHSQELERFNLLIHFLCLFPSSVFLLQSHSKCCYMSHRPHFFLFISVFFFKSFNAEILLVLT